MSSMIKPDWWDTWVIQGLYNTILRDGAPADVKRAFNRWKRDQVMIKV